MNTQRAVPPGCRTDRCAGSVTWIRSIHVFVPRGHLECGLDHHRGTAPHAPPDYTPTVTGCAAKYGMTSRAKRSILRVACCPISRGITEYAVVSVAATRMFNWYHDVPRCITPVAVAVAVQV